jgi:hypothetical protein
MFKTDLGFNPFDSAINVNAGNNSILRKKFFDSFGIQHIFCYNNNPRKKLSGMNHTSNINEVITQNVNNNSDAYFYVNGSRKKEEVTKVTACYIDLDAGRDANGHYFAPKIVAQQKAKFLDKINGFSVKPTWIIDTRNGYQIYWILTEKNHTTGLTRNKKYWNGIQKKLANYFDADIRAMKINQIFRIPFTWWRKPWEGKKSYFSTILNGSTGQPVSIVKLQEALTGQSAQVHVKSSQSSDAWYESWRNAANKADQNSIPLSVDCATKILTDLVKTEDNPVILAEDDDIPDYIENEEQTIALIEEDDDTNSIFNTKCIPNEHQLKLLSTVVDFLNQVSTPLFFSNNKFLSASAKELAAKLSDEFCVG